jgi:hypothetical protein
MVGALMLTAVGCGSVDSDDRPDSGEPAAESAALGGKRRLPRRPKAPPPPTQDPAPPTQDPGGSGLTTEQVIAAAQTPDGRAIPQPSGANGACPEVVVRLGFWSCPTINDTCSFTSGGATTHCTCSRTDGEGQSPTWICQ